LGFVILEFFLGRAGVDLTHSKDDGALAVMTALEVGEQKVNIMINDLGSFTPFGFGDLNADDLALIESATLVGVLDWCLNRAGTDLAAGVLDHLAARPQCADVLVYFDSSDPAPRKDEVPEMVARVLRHPRLNYLGVNEHELRHYAGSAGSGIMDDTPAGMEAMARTLNRTVPATTSAHTAALAIQVDEGPPEKVWLAPSYNLQPKRTTGAGDTWNGGNMLGILLGLETDERLLLANAVAGYYIAAPEAVRPTLAEVIDFMEHHKDGLRPIALPAYASDGRAGSR
jgi:sugar/nucleoside kinase (ribokinase family)